MNPKLYALLSKLSYEDNATTILNKGKKEFLRDEWESNPKVDVVVGRMPISYKLQDKLQDNFKSYEDFENQYLSNYQKPSNDDFGYISAFLRKKDEYNSLEGFTVIDSKVNTARGYFGIAVERPNGEIVISHRGSDDLKDWIYNNRNFIGKDAPLPPQLEDANLLVERVMQGNGGVVIEQTGHSSGGALAQLSAHEYGNQKAITFDAPGVKKWIKEEDNALNGTSLHEGFENYIATGSWVSDSDKKFVFNPIDPRIGINPNSDLAKSMEIEIDLSLLKNHAGKVHRIDLYLPDEEVTITDVYPTHKIANFIDAFDDEGRNIKNLEDSLHLDKLLRKRWNENSQALGRVHTSDLHSEYGSFEDFKAAYLEDYKDELSFNVSHDRLLIQEQGTEQFMDEIGIDLYGENEPENHVEIDTSHILSQITILNTAIDNI